MPKMLCRGGTLRRERPERQPESLLAVNRIVPSDRVPFSPTMENEQAPPTSFSADTALDDAAPRRIFRSTVIFTRVVAPQWILLLPRLLTISKPSRHRGFDPPPGPTPPLPLTVLNRSTVISSPLFFYPYLPIRLDSIDDRVSIIDNHSDSGTFRESKLLSPRGPRDPIALPPLQTAKAFSRIIATLCSSPCT